MFLRGSYGVWIIGCVACLIAFMSVFFSSQKIVFKSLLDTSSTQLSIELPSLFFLSQSQHLFDTWWINRESYCLLNNFSTARSIDRASVLNTVGCSSTLARHLHMSTAIFSTPSSTAARYLSTPTFVEIY